MKGSRFVLRAAVAAGLAALVAAAVLAIPAESDQARGAWGDGDRELGSWAAALVEEGYGVRSVLSSPLLLDEVTEPSRTAWVVVGMERPYTAEESAALGRFLDAGGNVLLADAAGYGNLILHDLGLRLGSSRILDERFQGNLSFVAADGNVGGSTFPLLLNRPVPLVLDETFEGNVLVATSQQSYLDADGNERIDQTDLPGPFPVMAHGVTPGGGQFVVSGDVGVFINQHFDDSSYNHRGFQAAVAGLLLPGGGQILVDESAYATTDDAARGVGYGVRWVEHAREAGLFPLLAAVVLGVAAFPWAVARPEDWRRHAPNFASMAREPAPEEQGRILRSVAREAIENGAPHGGLVRRAMESPESLGETELRDLATVLARAREEAP